MTDREKIIYDILCSDEQPPEGQHWEGFVTNKIVAALAQPKQEPVAWMWDVYSGAGYTSRGIDFYPTNIPFAKHTPLYTAPTQREVYCGCGDEIVAGDGARCGTCVAVKYKERVWVGLTDEEIEDLWGEPVKLMYSGYYNAIRAIEAKLKDKNYD